MKYQKRSVFGWGSTAAARATPRKGLVVHYDGSNQGLARKAHTSCVAYWKATRKFHMGPARRWADIGYSFGACPHGYVMEGRGLDRVQAAQPGGNDTWYSVTLMSGPGEDPTPAQIDAVRQLRAWLMGKGVGGSVRGHRDFISTSCPGDRLYRLVKNGTFSKAATGAAEEEDDVSAGELWGHKIAVPDYAKDLHPKAKEYAAGGWLRGAEIQARRARVAAEANGAAVAELSKALGELAADRGQTVDVDALVERIGERIEAISVRLDVEDAEDAS